MLRIADAAARVVWWVDLERVDARDELEPERSILAGEVRLAQGELELAQP
ncbi:hypothetical protein DB30_03169 [Enhygromyxa salina]|uniref:Uncharacterized protein n=1 Tax=Enhygromyxa salina TaxID=215803 RepID=A0A0C2A236_9BACT|nr:hypothetical protein [Enhygromyxa salina]KIG17468.1 hypothetical protein DB30_03169 [Enhygromyxa salina]